MRDCIQYGSVLQNGFQERKAVSVSKYDLVN